MSKVAIVSDSNSGITQSMAKELGVTVMPMPFFVGDKTLYEDIDLSQEEFYQMLSEKTDIHTSMPLVGNVTDTWDELLKEYDEIVHIPMSSGLSGSEENNKKTAVSCWLHETAVRHCLHLSLIHI